MASSELFMMTSTAPPGSWKAVVRRCAGVGAPIGPRSANSAPANGVGMSSYLPHGSGIRVCQEAAVVQARRVEGLSKGCAHWKPSSTASLSISCGTKPEKVEVAASYA
jgi:hypothetical protein